MEFSKQIAASFNLDGEPIPLAGGQNTSVKINDAVLKPVDDEPHSEWLLNVIDKIVPDGYRLSKPIRSKNGKFVSKGWICMRFERGHETRGNIEEKLRVSRLFHRDISGVSVRDFPQPDHVWSKAHRIAWQTKELPEGVHKDARDIVESLLCSISLQKRYNVQVVHGDLSGNILLDDALEPLIIDFSPTVAPVEYAEAILACDCIAWQGSPISELDTLPDSKLYNEMILRAVIFRLTVAAICSGQDYDAFMREFTSFRPIVDKWRERAK